MRVAYFVHDLNDAAVARRVRMLKAGGNDVVATGFWRGDAPPRDICGAPAIALAQSFDARLVRRALATLRQTLRPNASHTEIGAADLMIARNLEMLAIALSRSQGNTPVIYEALDLHRLLLGPSLASRALRQIESALMRRSAMLLTSSPGFLRAYFHNPAFARPRLPTMVVENRLLRLDDGDTPQPHPQMPPGPPWIVGWFGMLRCRRSLEILARLARRRPDLVRIRIFGRPAPHMRERLSELVRSAGALEFGGGYGTGELARLYANVHFNWAIDYFEENANSEWLLPNRIYEGGSADAIALALARTETGRWLGEHNLGVLFDDAQSELEGFFEALSAGRYETLKWTAAAAPRSLFVAGRADCAALAETLSRLVPDRDGREASAAFSKAAA